MEENQYIDLVKKIVESGSIEDTRNGKTKSIFGYSMRFSLLNGTVPLLTTKKMAWKTCVKELLWFIRGSTSNTELVNENVHIWSKNATGSGGLAEGDLGPIYGHQWRHYNAPYEGCNADYTGKGVDQLQNIIDALNDPKQRSSRRLVISSWNPSQMDEMELPPCHVLMQFNVRDNKYLSCSLYQRSGDVGLGVPFNIASYAFLTHILAKHCGLEAEEFVYFLGNAHIYEEHEEALQQQMKREPKMFPRISIQCAHEKIEDYKLCDIEWITPYECHGTVAMEMKA